MKKKYYFIRIEDGIEPVSFGPFDLEELRDEAAHKMHKANQIFDEDTFIWLDVEGEKVTTGSYSNGFFEEPFVKEKNIESEVLKYF